MPASNLMSDDTTRKLSGDGNEPIDAKRFDALVDAVQSMSVRLEAIEKAVTARAYDTKPIWEQALAEIAGTRAELAETRGELAETRAEVAETRGELAETRAEVAETRAEVAETRTELAATRAELK